ncbi:serine/threonine-protein kinase [Streptomyces griseus]|uniref:serine/threonine-protein kinase n=1 Tax=Streptomyces griseus TaxID=1911 RepID=UPI00056D4017|nr:serine/threonine-protein kinase [Streptomyces griseus]
MGTEGADIRVIAGRYRLEARLGRGGMGVVWRATDQLLGRRVAVKEIAQDNSLSAEEARQQRDRTLREARAVAQLSHPHIIVVHDVVVDDERPYIVMELIEGGSLADRISAGGPVGAQDVARIGVALLSALNAAHAAGVLHRDIKPANVLMESGSDRVVLTDFGIAQVAGATTLTETGSFVGSPEYTAPERMSGSRTGPESDLWSLGALLCTALSGESPFRRDSLGGILHAVVFAEFSPPDQAAPLLPVVQGLLERDPERRLGATEAERMLRTFLDTGRTPQASQVPASPPSATDRQHGYTPTHRDLPSQQPPAAAPPRAGQSTRGMLVAALLVAAMAGAGVSAAALLMNGDDDGDGRPGSSAPHTPADTSSTAAHTSSSATSTTSPAARTSSGAPNTSTAPAPALTTAPSGYRVARDPAGFSFAVPDGFRRDSQGERVFYLSPGDTFRIGVKVTDPEPGGPLAVMRRAAAKGPDTNPGYRDGRVTETTQGGRPAALWEFTWNGFNATEGARHTYDLCWEEGGRMYDVWVSAPVGKVREAREYFDVAVDTFVRT